MDEIVRPTVAAMAEDGAPFVGFLYAGLMLGAEGPRLVEYNVRFGDPEAEVVLPRLEDDLLDLLVKAVDGRLAGVEPAFRAETALTVVMAANGYPGDYATGEPIRLREHPDPRVKLFHAGTRAGGDALVSSGGRVLSATARGPSLGQARDLAYDAIGRVQASADRSPEIAADSDLGDYIHLGPLGTALLPYDLPRVLLIDELDKGDIDLPNDLLNVFEEGEYDIPELVRFAAKQAEMRVLTADRGGSAVVREGVVRCREFPVVIITSNGEREFPPAFLRRCLKLHVGPPDFDQLGSMVAAHFGEAEGVDLARLIAEFVERSGQLGGLASDQLLNAVHLATQLVTSGEYQQDAEWNDLLMSIWHPLSSERE